MTLEFKLKINPEYEALYPPLTDKEKQDLEKAIIEYKGNHTAIIADQHGFIVEGHHRFHLCEKHGFEPKFEVRVFANEIEVLKFIKSCNHDRRHLNEFQKCRVALNFKQAYEKRARENMSKAGKGVSIDTPLGRVNKQLADEFRTTATNIHRTETILKKASQQVINKLERSFCPKINQEYEKIQVHEKRQALINEVPIIDLPSDCELKFGSCMELSKEIPDNSIDLVLTDPPYLEHQLESSYTETAKIASLVLKKGGFLVTIAPHISLNKVLRILDDNCSNGLRWYWPYISIQETTTTTPGRKVLIEYKPFLMYVKGSDERILTLMHDVIYSKKPDKIGHNWQQSPVDSGYFIKWLTVEGQTVLDPFLGAGTNGLAALKLKRRFIGYEKDENTFKMARNSLSLRR